MSDISLEVLAERVKNLGESYNKEISRVEEKNSKDIEIVDKKLDDSLKEIFRLMSETKELLLVLRTESSSIKQIVKGNGTAGLQEKVEGLTEKSIIVTGDLKGLGKRVSTIKEDLELNQKVTKENKDMVVKIRVKLSRYAGFGAALSTFLAITMFVLKFWVATKG